MSETKSELAMVLLGLETLSDDARAAIESAVCIEKVCSLGLWEGDELGPEGFFCCFDAREEREPEPILDA